MKYFGRKLLFFLIILIPFWSFLIWFFWPKQELRALILDKTVLTSSGEEHRSLNWVLTHEKWTKSSGSQYDIADDYYGFFPINRPEYQIKDLTPYSGLGLDSMADYYQMAYFTDAYGIYQNEWYAGRDINERSPKVYGGLFNQDYLFMRKMYQKRKLMLAEFNIIASPTPIRTRERVEDLMNIDFSGWTGRYYHSLDTIENPDIPRWMRRLHERYYNRKFDYPDVPGIVMIHETEKILVLEKGKHLEHEVPIIHTPPEYSSKYGVPDYIRYPFWFDITFAQNPDDIYASYNLNTTSKGDSALGFHYIPSNFPAIIGDSKENLKYYFCGDFSDNPIPFGLAYFKGVEYIRKLFYNNQDPLDRKKFFWEYYRPLMTTIIQEYEIAEREGSIQRDTLRPLQSFPKYRRFYKRYGYRRPQIGSEDDAFAYNPNTIYGSDIRGSAIFSEESEYEEEDGIIERDEEGNPLFLRDVEEAPTPEEAEAKREEELAAEADRVAIERRRRLEAEAARRDSIEDYRAAQAPEEESPVEAQEENPEPVEASGPRRWRYEVGGRQPHFEGRAMFKEPVSSEAEPEETTNTPPEKIVPEKKKTKEKKPAEQKPAEKTPPQQKPATQNTERPAEPEPKAANTDPSAYSMPTGWKIVLASFDDVPSAQAFVQRSALEDQIVYVPSVNNYRVVLGNFENLREAQLRLNEIRAQYPKAWISQF